MSHCFVYCFAFILLGLTMMMTNCRNPDFLDIYKNPNATWAKEDIVFALDFPYDSLLCKKCHRVASGSGYNTAKFYASAAAVAVEDVNNGSLLGNHTLRYIWDKNETDTHCNEITATKIQLKQMKMGVHAFIGFACRCLSVANNAAAMNLPLLSMSCSENQLSNKEAYPTFARTTALNSEVRLMIVSLFKKFNWTQFAVVYERTHIFSPIYNGLKQLTKEAGSKYRINLEESYSKEETYRPNEIHESLAYKFGPFLDKLPSKARIVLLLIDKKYLIQFITMAAERGLTDSHFAFIAVHPFATFENVLHYHSPIRDMVWFLSWSVLNDTISTANPSKIRKAYQSLMVLMPEYPPSLFYSEFKKRVKNGMLKVPFLSKMQTNSTAPPPEAARLYDAVQLYAVGLNRTISQGGSITNGTAILENLKGLQQTSITGQRYIVNGKADVQKYFDILQFQIEENITAHPHNCSKCWRLKKLYEVVPVYNASQPDLTFKLVDSDRKPYFRYGIPLDVPRCGFLGEKCLKIKRSPVTIILSSSLGFLLITSLLLLIGLHYRNQKIRVELNSQLWKVDLGDLYFHDWKGASASSLGSWNSETNTISQKFTTVAVYNGTHVALKKIQQESVEITESVLIELKQMRDIRHNNLNQFVGACVEPNNIMVIYQYASKGSLQDILENSEIKLDTLFILSLIHDIVKGMLYLHSTNIKAHGNLKSSNCVVDSRWVLKVTEYGPDSFRNRCPGDSTDLNYNRLLWRAPELLRTNRPEVCYGTQKGDVYSFGIILQECQTRDGAWGSACQEAEVIVERVRECSKPPYRPIVQQLLDGAEGLRDVMKKCWNENPDERPSFSDLCKDVESMMKANNLKTNIFDNMIYMMEKHSNNLEEIVEERTSSLIDEKHKVESLLERMLPKSVARQLMKGKEVEAESFEEVTIYFSDIVGFTTICSSKTPMEVVKLLNCLYTMFDAALQDYDVYKVETIGDAYMVVSGLPVRNGKQHAKEISLFALDILKNVHSFKSALTNMDGKLMIRIGIHCGPVVAGVVGSTMPRYCLFGDTVNVASRMESTGKALHIHISKNVKSALDCFQGFSTEPRGLTEVKGKGELETFWLTGIDPAVENRGSNRNRNPNEFYSCAVSSSMYDFIRESPKIKHSYQKPHLQEFTQKSPFLTKSGSTESSRINNDSSAATTKMNKSKDHSFGFGGFFSPNSYKKRFKAGCNNTNGSIELTDSTIDTVRDTDQLISNEPISCNDVIEPSPLERRPETIPLPGIPSQDAGDC